MNEMPAGIVHIRRQPDVNSISLCEYYADNCTGQRIATGQILERRISVAVLVVEALGGGWNVTELPTAQEVTTR